MLYESGSCSLTELLHLYEQLEELSDPDTDSGRRLLERILGLTKDKSCKHLVRSQPALTFSKQYV
jgi:hypothetical protein